MSESDSEIDDVDAHKASLQRLQSKDPDFYEFLKENDQELLNFENYDDDAESEGETEEADDVPSKLITKSKLLYLKENLRDVPSIQMCKELISAFKNVVRQVEGTKADMSTSDLFNDIIKLCLVDLVPALRSVLKITEEDKDPSKSKMWKKIHHNIKSYLIDLLKFLSAMKETSVLILLLKHVIHMVPYYLKHVKLSRMLVKRMVSFWCTNEDTIRVLSLLTIVRVARTLPKEHLGLVLKQMYFAYVRNTKFTSTLTWPMINFMKRSLTEVYSLNTELAYEHAFIYIRQLSIHLRNGITTKKKEAFQTVYNWQYIHCILHWAHLLCTFYDNDAVKSLVYPLVQTTIGTINLIPTAKYVPLRFHLIKALMHISKETETFIPILPRLLDVLIIVDYNKKSTFSVKPVEFSCALKVTKSQLLEAGFKDACITEFCDMTLKYFELYLHTIGFPELALPAVLQMKAFTKQCKVTKYNQQIKGLVVKIEENSKFVSEKRRIVSFKITDDAQIKQWEENVKNQGTPIQSKVQQEQPTQPLKKKQKLSRK